jgi:hypothetical protein
VKTFGRFSSHRRFEDRRIFPAGSLNQGDRHPTLSTWFISEYKKSGKKLDMGKGCVRFKSLEDLALDVVGCAVARVSAEEHMTNYQAARALLGKEKSRAKKGAKKSAVKKPKPKK